MKYLAISIVCAVLVSYLRGFLGAWRMDRWRSSFQRQHQAALNRATLRSKAVLVVLNDRMRYGR